MESTSAPNDDPVSTSAGTSPKSNGKKKINNSGPKERLRMMEEWKQEIDEWKDEIEEGRATEMKRLVQEEVNRVVATNVLSSKTISESSGVTFDVDKDMELSGLRTEVEDLRQQLREQQDLLVSMKSSASLTSEFPPPPPTTPKKESSATFKKKGSSLSNLISARREHKLLPPDTYSFLVYSEYWNSDRCPKPGKMTLLSLGVMAVQVFAYSFFAADVMDVGSSVEIRNPIGMPAGAELVVRLSQVLALFITTMSQDEIHFSLNALKIGYQRDLYEDVLGPNATFAKWLFSIILRFLVGFLSITVTFMLIVTSETVRDLMLDFTAVTFVSELDNAVFLLARLGYFGDAVEQDADKCTHTSTPVNTSASQYRHFRKRLPRWALLVVINVIMFTFWLWLTMRQVNGKYLEPAVYIQMADGYNTELAAFSGWYIMDGDSLHDGRVIYKARTNAFTSNISDPGTFRYSRGSRTWLFSHSPPRFNNNQSDIRYYAISEETITFDIASLGDVDNWYVHSQAKDRDLSMDIFSLQPYIHYVEKACQADSDCGLDLQCKRGQCICPSGRLGANCELDPPCDIIEIDPSTSAEFEGARFWATTYHTVPDQFGVVLQSYGKPIYVGTNEQGTGVDVIIFTGVQWCLVHESDFQSIPFPDLSGLDFHSPEYAMKVVKTLSENFHAYWSRYKIAYVSEYVYVDTSSDSASPVGLSWEIWGEIRNLPSDIRMLCTTCNANTNPCFFGGTCTPDKTCDCGDSGATGALCQISPQGDGHCDAFFNIKGQQFDNGDCCMETCISTSTYTCGWEKAAEILGLTVETYVGFDTCIARDVCPSQRTNNCWTNIYEITAESSRTICKSAVSGNGGVWATGMCADEDTSDVLTSIFSQTSSGWGQRGQSLPGQIVELSYDGTTAAVNLNREDGTSVVAFYLWQAHRQNWATGATYPTTTALGHAVSVRSIMNPRIAIMSEQSITVYELNFRNLEWERVGDPIALDELDGPSNLSLDLNGNTMVLLRATSAFIFVFDEELQSWSIKPQTFRRGQLVRHADISNDGTIVAFWLVSDQQDEETTCTEGTITILMYSEKDWIAAKPDIPISAHDYYDQNGQTSNPVFALSGDGRFLLFLDCNTSSTVVYGNNKKGWKRLDELSVGIGLRETGLYYGISYSDDGKLFSLFESHYNGKATLYNNPSPTITTEPLIGNGTEADVSRTTLSIEIQLDDYPEDIGLYLRCGDETFGEGSFGQFTVPSQYANTTISVERGSSCEFTIFDLAGDGLCCPNEGFYRIYYGQGFADRNLLVDGSGLFGHSATSTFLASRPP